MSRSQLQDHAQQTAFEYAHAAEMLGRALTRNALALEQFFKHPESESANDETIVAAENVAYWGGEASRTKTAHEQAHSQWVEAQ